MIWRQTPKVDGRGHYGHRIAFGPDGFLYISSGERQKFTPAQDMQPNLGKIVRLNDDGSVPADNPFADRGGVTAQIWSLGHRNPLGLAFDAQGRLWNVEMGPQGGDELNLVQRGANYGYPIVSNGNHYGGADIPDHDTRPDLAAPAVFWNPVISPSSLLFYSGSEFPDWQGDAFIGGLSSTSIVRIELGAGGTAREAARYRMPQRMRAVEQGPDGAIWALEDGRGGRLLRLTAPARRAANALVTCRFRIEIRRRPCSAASQKGIPCVRHTLVTLLAGVGTAGLAGLAAAHHSQAGIFDSRETIEVTGVIKSISWRNPHGQILLDVD